MWEKGKCYPKNVDKNNNFRLWGQKQCQKGRKSLDNDKIPIHWECITILNLDIPDEITSNT